MLFNSIEFLFVFLPLVLLGFHALRRLGNRESMIIWLVFCSLFFYAWWNPVYLFLLLGSLVVNYNLGRRLAANGSRGWLVAGIFFNLGMLAYFKYANFFLDNLRFFLDTGFNFEHIILPLAISFYTFQQITYLVDTSKGLTKPHGLLEYSLFVCFFPQLIAGPIVHHSEMLEQFDELGRDRDEARQFGIGFTILTIGLFKKVVIADTLALFSTPVFDLAAGGAALHSIDIAAATLAYSFQLYFDFSGYSDMAIGLATLFGIKLPVNFFSPYRAQNISDFWRMWHATLSRFLRDYVYTPLGGFFCSPGRQRFNLFVTMFAGGVWHGAGWTFVVYGVLHGSYVVIHQLWRIKVSGPLGLVGRRWYQCLAQLLTFLTVTLSLVVFRADSVATAGHMFRGLFTPGEHGMIKGYRAAVERSNLFRVSDILIGDLNAAVLVYSALIAALLTCWLAPNTYQLFQSQNVVLESTRAGRPAPISLSWSPSVGWALFTGLLLALAFLNLGSVSEFLYFQF